MEEPEGGGGMSHPLGVSARHAAAGGLFVAELEIGARKIPDFRPPAGPHDIAARFLWLRFSHVDTASVGLEPGEGVLHQLPRRAVVVSRVVLRFETVDAPRKVHGRNRRLVA